jgi:hypothetical protein
VTAKRKTLRAPTWGSTKSTGAARSPDRGEIDEVAVARYLFKIHGGTLQRMGYCRGTRMEKKANMSLWK